ncbi:aminopeptidase [Candidatus Woesearchaeota archaeon]|nr:aminopeptidase [Candidatus Woesearchaeota archaeon]
MMVDPRIKKLAGILVNYSIKIKKGNVIEISCGPEAKSLALEVYKLVLLKGAFPRLRVGLPGAGYLYYKHATKAQLEHFPKISYYEAKNLDGYISIGTEYNTKELTSIDPKKIATRSRVMKKISDVIVDKDNWVVCEYPTNSLAQDAEMSLEEFEDFCYKATNQDWAKEAKRQEKLVKLLNKANSVRIVAKDTDIKFSIKGKKAIKCAGTRNMPDGEVFTEPVKRSVNGYISYSFPAIKSGKEVNGIKLEFKNGKVVKASAEKNEKFLKEMLKVDPGASYVGEFGIGINYGIKKFIKQILFDEKIGGTIHLALGRGYKETGGENKSAIHWDMILDMRNGGKLYFDNKLIQKNGKFTIKL